MPGRLRAVADQRQRKQRDRRDQTQPREQVEHRHIRRAPEQQVAGRKAERRDHQDRKGTDAEIVTDGAADHQQADRGNADADGLPRARPLAEQQRGKADGEQRLALHDHAGKADGNAMRDGKGLRQKLAEEQREADRDQHAPRNLRPRHEQAGQGGDGKAQRRHQFRRKFVQRDPARDKGKPPDHRHQDGDADIGRFHFWLCCSGSVGFLSSVGPALVCAGDRCRAAARDSRPIPA